MSEFENMYTTDPPDEEETLVRDLSQTALLPELPVSEKGNLSAVLYLLKLGADVNTTQYRARTPLMLTSCQGHLDVVKCLLNYNADVNEMSKSGVTALAEACKSGDSDVVRCLLHHNAEDTYDYEPFASHFAFSHIDVVRLLLEEANSQVDDMRGDDDVTLTDIDKLILSKGSWIDQVNSRYETVLHLACKDHEADMDLVKFLILSGADVNAKDVQGSTPLLNAIRFVQNERNLITICDCLLKHGAVVSLEVHAAICRGHYHTQLVKFLLQSGAAPSLQKLNGYVSVDSLLSADLNNSEISPLFTAFVLQETSTISTIVDLKFLHQFDLNPPASVMSGIRNYYERNPSKDCMTLLHGMYGELCTLRTLCFVAVSHSVGFGLERQERVAQTRLPPSLQRELMFRTLDKTKNKLD